MATITGWPRFVRLSAVASVLVTAISLGFGVKWSSEPPESHSCPYGGAGFERRGAEVWLQDQGKPGRDACDLPSNVGAELILGFDCKLRLPDGRVIAVLQANGPHGACVIPMDSYPTSWTGS